MEQKMERVKKRQTSRNRWKRGKEWLKKKWDGWKNDWLDKKRRRKMRKMNKKKRKEKEAWSDTKKKRENLRKYGWKKNKGDEKRIGLTKKRKTGRQIKENEQLGKDWI